MYQIRKGVFETNSSSTHAIAISRNPVKSFPDKIEFWGGEFGWENAVYENTGDYLYTGILNGPQDLIEPRLDRLKKLLDELGVRYVFHMPRMDESYGFCYYNNCFVDHAHELGDFIKAVLGDRDRLARFLFGDSRVYTGNDNQDPDPAGCNICDPVYSTYDENWNATQHENPYYDPEHYEYFEKGN